MRNSRVGRHDLAVDYIGQAIRLIPDFAPAHINLGKIFDITGQRERAVNEYRQALQTNDNTQGAGDEARKYIQKPYEREKQTVPGA